MADNIASGARQTNFDPSLHEWHPPRAERQINFHEPLMKPPDTIEAVAAFAAAHIDPSATVVSDGLWCFRATALVGAEHERIVTRGGKASVKPRLLRALVAAPPSSERWLRAAEVSR